MPNNPPKQKKTKKRHAVSVGDIVRIQSAMIYSIGVIGEVTHVLSKDQVVVKGMAMGDQDWEGLSWVIYTYKPSGLTKGGSPKEDYWPHITKVMFRSAPKPPKPQKKVLPPRVIETTDELIEHLASGNHRERVIIAPTATEKSA
jgi:hypothetical protein